eukprot:c24482_g2_i1 orf=267-4673(-)
MVAFASCGQAVSLLDCLFVLHSPSAWGRTRLHDRFPPLCKSQNLQARSLALVSALPELQHARTHLKAAPECYNLSDSEEPVKLDSHQARRKGRKKKAATALPHESHEHNGSGTLRIKSDQTSQDFLSVVRSVVNAEDSSNKDSNRAISDGFSLTLHSKTVEENNEENSATVRLQALEAKPGGSIQQVKPDDTAKKNVIKSRVEATLEVQVKQHHDNTGGNKIYTDNVTTAANGIDTKGNETSTSSRRKPRQRRWRKSGGELLEQDCGQTLPVAGLSDSTIPNNKASGTGHLEKQYLADECQNAEDALLEAHMHVGTEAVRLGNDAKIGEIVVDITEDGDSLPCLSSSQFIAEETANKDSKMSGRKKKSRDSCLEQSVSRKVDKIQAVGAADMCEMHSSAGKGTESLDQSTLTNQSSSRKCRSSQQHATAKINSEILSRHENRVQAFVPEALDGEESAHTATKITAAGVDEKVTNVTKAKAQTHTNFVGVDGTDSEGLGLRQESSRLPKNPKRSRRSRKQQLTEEVNLSKEDGEGCKALEPDQGMCTVRWLVETRLDVNQKLFLVGESPHLGAWDPSMATSFSLCQETGKVNLWQGQSQVPFGTYSEYNYFVQVGNNGTDHIVWRPGPRLHLATPSKDSQDTEVTVKDALGFDVANKLPALLWEGLQNEIGFPTELRQFLGDEIVLKETLNLPSLEGGSNKIVSKEKEQPDVNAHDLLNEQKEDFQHVVQVDDGKSDSLSRHTEGSTLLAKPQAEDHLRLTPKLKKFIKKRVFPREEPWLMESMILYEKCDVSKPAPAANSAETGQELEDSQDVAIVEKIPEKGEISTEILINSSKCTMERIAILEDGKLVELLLKPVNSEINVGNVYLGIVKKLLPGMTGVFVDIGHPRVALLTITKNMYPFTFPPIPSNENSSNGHVNDSEGRVSGKQEVASVELVHDFEKCDELVEEDWETEDEDDEEDVESEVIDDMEETDTHTDASHEGIPSEKMRGRKLLLVNEKATRPITVNFGQRFTKWRKVEEGMRIIVQVKREPLGKKGPKVCAFPQLSSRFWVLGMGGKSTGVSKKIHGPERKRLKDLANLYRKPGFDLTVRTEAAGQSQEDLEKDMMRLFDTWKEIMEQAEAASIAVENGQDGAVPALLHRAMGQTLSIVRDFFAEKVQRMVVDTAQTYHEVTSYLQEVAPQLQNRVELYTGTTPIFDVFNLEADIDKLLNERVQLANGAYLVIEETEALVTIDVNGGAGMLGKSMKSAAILEANLAAARQIAAELRLRDIGGIIVIDFIDMDEDEHEALVYEEMRNAIQSDRSIIYISEISDLGLMELTRRRVRPSVTFMISDPCSCCRGTGRVEALETTFSKIERAILRLVANHSENIHFDGRTWKKVLLRVDPVMFEFLTRKQRAAQLSSSLMVYIILKVGREMSRGSFELSELKLGNEKRPSATGSASGQQHRSLRKAVRLGAGGRRDFTSRA